MVRIAIVGGGCAGMAAAWELSRNNLREDAQEHYDITVYEATSMLGGKGSSWRDDHGRIREHGLHIWLGFYENAFRMMREVYAEAQALGLGPDAKLPGQRLPFGRLDDAFRPEAHVGVANQNVRGDWEAWTGLLPPRAGLPGEDMTEDSNPFTLTSYLSRCIALSLALMNSTIGPAQAPAGEPRPDERSSSDEQQDLDFAAPGSLGASRATERMAHWIEQGLLTTAAGVLQGASLVETWLREFNPLPQFDSTVLRYLEDLATQVRKRLRKFVAADPETRRKTEVIDLILTIVFGLYRDRVLFDQARGLDAIDDIDCKAWLLKHGALRSSVESPFVTGLYDLAFCYRDGDRTRPALAAGQALRGALRMFFSYRGSIFWRMGGGMGETVFSPLYRVLSSRERHRDGQLVKNPLPVKFEFLHRLDSIESEQTGPGRHLISGLVFESGGKIAHPLDDFGCWGPPVAFAQQGPPSRRRLKRRTGPEDAGRNTFDGVVLALGLDDVRAVVERNKDCVLATDPDWKLMLANLRTVGTQAAQAWLKPSLSELGWTRGPVLISGYEVPLETWADMTHTLPSERLWAERLSRPASPPAQTVVYFCGVLSDKDIAAAIPKATAGQAASTPALTDAATDKALQQHVRHNLENMLKTGMRPFWPLAYASGKTAYDKLAEPLGRQHWQANWQGSSRYTLALPGTSRYRMSPLEITALNLTIAGDWTSCSFNEGCVEAAVMSGMLAANAIAGRPHLEDIIGYDHP